MVYCRGGQEWKQMRRALILIEVNLLGSEILEDFMLESESNNTEYLVFQELFSVLYISPSISIFQGYFKTLGIGFFCLSSPYLFSPMITLQWLKKLPVWRGAENLIKN